MIKAVITCFLLITLGLASVSFASDARTVLSEYLALDAKGARLQGWQSENYLLKWQEEPGWDEITIITGYTIKSEKCDANRCAYVVTYALYPVASQPQVEAHPKGGEEDIIYRLVKQKDRWFLEDFVKPHVLVDAYQRKVGN